MSKRMHSPPSHRRKQVIDKQSSLPGDNCAGTDPLSASYRRCGSSQLLRLKHYQPLTLPHCHELFCRCQVNGNRVRNLFLICTSSSATAKPATFVMKCAANTVFSSGQAHTSFMRLAVSGDGGIHRGCCCLIVAMLLARLRSVKPTVPIGGSEDHGRNIYVIQMLIKHY